MPWPWVRHARYAHDTTALRARAEAAEALANALLNQLSSLTHDLLLHHAALTAPATPPTTPPAPPLAPPTRDEITDAIDLAAGADAGLNRHLTRWARTQRMHGEPEHDIIQAILHWRAADEWDGAATDTPTHDFT